MTVFYSPGAYVRGVEGPGSPWESGPTIDFCKNIFLFKDSFKLLLSNILLQI